MQHIGLGSLAVYFFVIAYILTRYGVRHNHTLSDHVAKKPQRGVFVPVTFVTNSVLFFFIFTWLLPRHGAHVTAYYFVTVAFLAQLATTTIPRLISYIFTHDSLAVLSAIGMYATLISLYISSSLQGVAITVLLVAIATMTFLGALLTRYPRTNYVYYQLSYHSVFSCAIVFIGYQ